MNNHLPGRPMAAILTLLILSSTAGAQSDLTLKDVIERNIQAAGGREKLSLIRNISFKIGGMRYIALSTGEIKMTTGKEPVITEVTLVKGDSVRRNSFYAVSELSGIPKTVNLVLAKLYSGVFTLMKFEKELTFQGLKSYGPEKFYLLTAKSEPLNVDFFLRADNFCLKRLVFRGATPEGDKYEVNYDFGPFEDAEGLKIPLAWFNSQVGTRGTLAEVSEFKINQPLDKDFFVKLEVNLGTTEAGPGRLKGNVLDFGGSPAGLSITTNWTRSDVEKTGFRSGDKLELSGEGFAEELVFYASSNELPPRDILSQGARLLAPAPRGGETFVIQFIAVDTAQLASKLKALAAIEITKK